MKLLPYAGRIAVRSDNFILLLANKGACNPREHDVSKRVGTDWLDGNASGRLGSIGLGSRLSQTRDGQNDQREIQFALKAYF